MWQGLKGVAASSSQMQEPCGYIQTFRYRPALDETATQFPRTSTLLQYASYLHPNGNAQLLLPQTHCMPMEAPCIRYYLSG